ncbi:hypothetical protein C0J52_16549 [Blattella germanica]|nr:hypothetical protein C0J52_16549 [Blattella germanica]
MVDLQSKISFLSVFRRNNVSKIRVEVTDVPWGWGSVFVSTAAFHNRVLTRCVIITAYYKKPNGPVFIQGTSRYVERTMKIHSDKDKLFKNCMTLFNASNNFENSLPTEYEIQNRDKLKIIFTHYKHKKHHTLTTRALTATTSVLIGSQRETLLKPNKLTSIFKTHHEAVEKENLEHSLSKKFDRSMQLLNIALTRRAACAVAMKASRKLKLLSIDAEMKPYIKTRKG